MRQEAKSFPWQPGWPHQPEQKITGLHMNATKKLAKSIFAAASTYLRLRDRLEHPAGKFDSAGRFYLIKPCDCCSSIRYPSRAYPYSHMIHGRSVVHVATAAGLADYARAVRSVAGVIDREGVEAIPAYLVSKPFLKLMDACAVAGLEVEVA